MGCNIMQTGLVVCDTDNWLAVSPDGIITEKGKPKKLLEIKCPFKGVICNQSLEKLK